jgi:hypothetical protein
MINNRTPEEKPKDTQEDSTGCYTTESLAKRLNVSKKFIVSHRRQLPGAMKIGRIWRFNKASIEKKLVSGFLLG